MLGDRTACNRIHAILGTSEQCIATHPSDLAVALAALDAIVHVRGAARRERTIPFARFHVVPGAHPERETTLAHGDVITAIDVPALGSLAARLYLKGPRPRELRLRARRRGSRARRRGRDDPRCARRARRRRHQAMALARSGGALRAGRRSVATFRAAAEAAVHGAVPHRDNAFKVELVQRTLVRALAEVIA